MIRRVALSLGLLLCTAAVALASPITYVHTGFGSGTIGGVAFGASAPVAFTITAQGDTANIVSCGVNCWLNNNTTASIDIAGVGAFQFVTATGYFSNVGFVGFMRLGAYDLFDGPALGVWDMASSIGPIAGTGALLQWGIAPIDTSGGVLSFTTGQSQSTFTATVGAVPEPSTWLLLGTGLAALAARRRFTKRA